MDIQIACFTLKHFWKFNKATSIIEARHQSKVWEDMVDKPQCMVVKPQNIMEVTHSVERSAIKN